MYKKIILTLAFAMSLFGSDVVKQDSKYLDDSKLNLSDLRIFVGADGAYSHLKSNERLDASGYGYSFYAGIPISDLELILKKKNTMTNSLDLDNNSIALNIPFGGTGSRMLYAGVISGNAKVNYKGSTATTYSVVNKKNDGNFYGFHIGKRYKFSQNFFGRMEFEYLKYNLEAKTTTSKTVDLQNTLDFIYGVEYRF